jgi:RHH-type rel operon transcriptional repressor/antitoxin RelB
MTSVRLPEEMEYRLNMLAVSTHRTKSFYIIEALNRCLEDFEDAYTALDRISRPNRTFSASAEMLTRLERDNNV